MVMAFSKRDSVGWLARSLSSGERPARSLKTGSGQELEDGVGAEGVVVVLVFVAGQDAVDAGPDHLQEGVVGEVGVAGVVEGVGEGPGETDALVELAEGEHSGVAGELTRGGLDDQRRAEKVQDLGPGGWYTHRLSSRLWTGAGASTGQTRPLGKDSATDARVEKRLSSRDVRPSGVADD
jgi:hypothetical protein